MCMRLFVIVIIVCAIAAGISINLPHEMANNVIAFAMFFNAALPILGFGALIKYLCCHSGKGGCGCGCGCCGPKKSCGDKSTTTVNQ